MKKWFSKEWWNYLLEKPNNSSDCNWLVRFWCRMNIHPKGVIWYNINGTEPDMHCKICNDNLD